MKVVAAVIRTIGAMLALSVAWFMGLAIGGFYKENQALRAKVAELEGGTGTDETDVEEEDEE